MKGTPSPRMLPHFLVTCGKDIKKPLNEYLGAFCLFILQEVCG